MRIKDVRWRSLLVGAVGVVAAVSLFKGCTKGGSFFDEEETRRGAVQGTGEVEGNFREFFREQYALPRAFPSDDPNNVQRQGPYQSLQNIRVALGKPDIPAQWLNAPGSPTCTPGCGEGSECFWRANAFHFATRVKFLVPTKETRSS